MFARIAGVSALVAAALCLSVAAPATTRSAPVAGMNAAQAESGAELFVAYCGPCHGRQGKGDGPVAVTFKKRPTDLTRLAVRNRGVFPHERVAMVLQFGVDVPAHGASDMPTWGPTFRVMGDEAMVNRRVASLTGHIESMQVRK